MAAENRTILLVEDNPDHEALTIRAIRKHNPRAVVRVAHDGVEALGILFPPGPSTRFVPDLILLDLMLPKIDGLQVLRRLRAEEHTRLIPTVVLTSSDEERDVSASYALGANSYIRKPVDYDEFLRAARELGVYWLEVNYPAPKPAM